jgi:hypothetical protein
MPGAASSEAARVNPASSTVNGTTPTCGELTGALSPALAAETQYSWIGQSSHRTSVHHLSDADTLAPAAGHPFTHW